MRKLISLLCIAAMAVNAVGCASEGKVQPPSLAEPAQISGEITVSCYDSASYKGFLEEAAKAFELEYPGTHVNIEAVSAMPEVKTKEENGKTMKVMTKNQDTQGESDYINKINTELMSGKGADILAMDILPYTKYAAGGQLEDLQKYIDSDPDFNMQNYRENILNLAKQNDGFYIFPMDYTFNYFAYDSSLLDAESQSALKAESSFSFEKLVELGQKAFDTVNKDVSEITEMFGLSDNTAQNPNMFSEMFKQDYESYINIETKEVNLNDGRFAALLESVKKYAASGYIKHSTTAAGEMHTISDMEKTQNEHFFFKPFSSMALIQNFDLGGRRMMFGTSSGNTENDEIAGIASGTSENIKYNFTQAYGINSNSQNKQTAWEFIKFLSGEKMQTSISLSGLPVNNKARAEKAKLEVTGAFYSPDKGSGELDEAGLLVYNEYIATIESFSDMINSFVVQDATVNNIIQSEVKYFFDGSRTAEEVAKTLQNKLELYLNE